MINKKERILSNLKVTLTAGRSIQKVSRFSPDKFANKNHHILKIFSKRGQQVEKKGREEKGENVNMKMGKKRANYGW